MRVLHRFKEEHMLRKSRDISLLLLVVLFTGFGCKGKKSNLAETASDPAEVEAYQTMVASGMKDISFSQIKQGHVGKQCVITASTPKKRSPTPPPRGTMRTLGDVSVYKAELESITPDGLKIRAPYASGNYWSVDIAEAQIISIAVAP
jgi:hypothetical protein